MGDVIGDLNSRRGQIQSMEDAAGVKVVRANVPLSEMFGYIGDLRSKTSGRAVYSMTFDSYAEVPKAVAEEILNGHDSRGIVIGGSGQGEAIVANKAKGIRAAVVYDEYSAKMSREHNDANIISLGSRTLSSNKAKELVKIWLDTSFSNEERHKRRIEKIKAIENNNF